MRRTLFFLFAALLLIAGWTASTFSLTVLPESKITVKGTSTMHDWTCETKAIAGAFQTASDHSVDAVSITVLVRTLECKNGTMNRKAYEALKSSAHPNISYQLTQAKVQNATAEGFDVAATGRLTIAGATKEIAFTANGKLQSDGRVRFTGSVPVKMSDFGIDPPTAMLGTMKTGNQVTVSFDIVAAR